MRRKGMTKSHTTASTSSVDLEGKASASPAKDPELDEYNSLGVSLDEGTGVRSSDDRANRCTESLGSLGVVLVGAVAAVGEDSLVAASLVCSYRNGLVRRRN